MYAMYDKLGRGDSGGMSMAIWRDKATGEIIFRHDARPEVGMSMRVGSISARSYSRQDWWQTTLVKEIISDTPDKVVFKTVNGSTYTWKVDV